MQVVWPSKLHNEFNPLHHTIFIKLSMLALFLVKFLTSKYYILYVDITFKLQDAHNIFIKPFSYILKDKSELGTRKSVSFTLTANVVIISTDGGSTANAAIGPTDDGRMYLRLQNIASMCICPSSAFNFFQHTPVVLPYRQDQTLKKSFLAFNWLAFSWLLLSWIWVLCQDNAHDLISELTEQISLEQFGREFPDHIYGWTPHQ